MLTDWSRCRDRFELSLQPEDSSEGSEAQVIPSAVSHACLPDFVISTFTKELLLQCWVLLACAACPA